MRTADSLNCGDCTACCWHDRVPLHPGEAALYLHTQERDGPKLDKRADGACVYLNAGGCSIHRAKPEACREFDCRQVVKHLEKQVPWMRAHRERANPVYIRIYAAGEQRLDTLEG